MTTVMVEAQGVRKNYGAIEILKGIDLQINKGTVTCLIGPSGSGKTTFLRCINHLEKINAGRLYVDEQLVGYTERNGRLYEKKESQTAKSRLTAGMVFQRFNLFPHMTVMENVIEAPVHVLGRPKKDVIEGGPGPAGPGWPGRSGPLLPPGPLRRPAAAHRHRPGPGHEAQADALRRTHLGT